ncbi:stage II sporulation protein E [Schnuerera sp. xch1]|uniref:stage II sporulation protein E n=1 Tax=Schnuerera sp. xch1 TaxID=2874283 RepID=UPI001CC18337|nr:stage II sporulation protein E [Schnuerera sp. xch1]MBZ2174583.1 stage II sporulation protein E [Schnuerera sp. xch1]
MLNTEYILSKEKRRNEMINFNWEYLIPIALAFFISRASIIERLTPFGIAFMSAYILAGKYNIYVFISTILGIFSFHSINGLDYMVTTTIVMILLNIIKSKETFSIIKSSIVTSGIFIFIKTLYLVIFKEVFIYDLLIITFEGLLVFTMTYIFSYSLSTNSEAKSYTNEKIICTFLTLALILLGIGSLSILEASLKNIISVLIILYFGYTEGAFIGSTIGITLGIVSYISQPEMPFILSIYGLAGLLTGVFKDLGKIGSILGFVLGNAIISFYINGYGISFIDFRELIISIVAFLVLYKPLNNYLSDYVELITKRAKEKSYSHRKDEMTINKLNEISDIFRGLGKTFKDSVGDNKANDVDEVYELINDVANSICSNCGMRKSCWKGNFYTTYNAMFKAISLLEENESLTDDNLPQFFKDYCLNKNGIRKEMLSRFERFKINNMWKNKIIQNRLLVSEQLEGVAKIMEDMANDIYINPIFKEDLEEIVYTNLKRNKVDIDDVIISELEDDNIEVYVEVNKAYKAINSQENIKQIVSDTIGIPLRGEFNINQSEKERVKFKLIKSNRYSAFTEAVSKPNYLNKVSGDNYTFGEGQNTYFAAISDGMGVGKKANRESDIAINLLEKFLDAKFDKELALKTINSILMLKSNDEIFTTFDISLIDLYSGKLQVIKTGAPATFIKKKNKVEVINSQSLPVGILDDVDFNVYEEYLEDGDIIIMMSDGILDANEDEDDTEKWMKGVINDIDSINPKTIATGIMNAAKEIGGEKARDDMTVLVTKVWKTI